MMTAWKCLTCTREGRGEPPTSCPDCLSERDDRHGPHEMVRTYRRREFSRACENFGTVDYTVTEKLTVVDGGIRVESHALGTCEGFRVDSKHSKFWPAVEFASACTYRERNGYTRVW